MCTLRKKISPQSLLFIQDMKNSCLKRKFTLCRHKAKLSRKNSPTSTLKRGKLFLRSLLFRPPRLYGIWLAAKSHCSNNSWKLQNNFGCLMRWSGGWGSDREGSLVTFYYYTLTFCKELPMADRLKLKGGKIKKASREKGRKINLFLYSLWQTIEQYRKKKSNHAYVQYRKDTKPARERKVTQINKRKSGKKLTGSKQHPAGEK